MKNANQTLNVLEDNLKIIGHQFKLERLKRDYSLRGMARAMHLSPTVIADIEAGRRIASWDVLALIARHLDIPFLTDTHLLKQALSDCILFQEALYHRRDAYAKEIYTRLLDIEPSLLYSPLHIEFQWVKVAYQLFIELNYDVRLLETYKAYLSNLSLEQTQRYYFMLGYAYVYQDDLDKGFSYFRRAQQYTQNSRIYGMTLSRLAELYQFRHHLYQAIETSRIASKIHAENAGLHEKFESDWRLARNLIEVGSVDQALVLITHMEASLVVETDYQTQVLPHVHFLRALAMYMNGQVEKALETIEQHSDILDLEYGIFFCALVHNTLGQVDAADAMLKRQLAQFGNIEALFKPLAEFFRMYLDKNTPIAKFEDQVKRLLHPNSRLPSPFIHHWVLDCAIRFFERNKEPEKALEMAKISHATRTFY